MFVLNKETQLLLFLEFIIYVFVVFIDRSFLLCRCCGFHSKELIPLLEVVLSDLYIIPLKTPIYRSKHVVSMTFIEWDVKQAIVAYS